MTVRLPGAVVTDDAMIAIVRGAVGMVDGARLDRPSRIARVLPGRGGPVEWRSESGGGISFDVDVAVAYGLPLPRVAGHVRSSVAQSVAQMTGLRVRTVDVTVTSLDRTEGER
jgi:uncharacterized alkaline shock family protein YloU